MLHAINQHKTSFYKRYLGHRDAEEVRVQEEDEITSLIMSPLAFLPPQEIGIFWERLVFAESKYEIRSDPVKRAKMFFWPRRNNIEPDMLVQLEWETGEKRYLMVEFKWNASLSGEDQLQNQWCNFLSDEERSAAYHIFIAPSVSCAITARRQNDVWHGRLVLRSWLQILSILNELTISSEGEGLFLWARQVMYLLQSIKIQPFTGFDKISGMTALPIIHGSPLFFRGFSGFKQQFVLPQLPDVDYVFFCSE